MTISRPGIGRSTRYGQIVPNQTPNAPSSLTRGFLSGTRSVGGIQTGAATRAIDANQRLASTQARYTSEVTAQELEANRRNIGSMLSFFNADNGGLNIFNDTAKELYSQWSSRATGNLIADPNFIEAASGGDPEQLARIRPLSREDQEFVGRTLMASRQNAAVQEYAAILTDPSISGLALQGLSPEERMRKIAEAKTRYRQGANQQRMRGLAQYFPEAAKQVIPTYMGQLSALDAKAMERQNQLMQENSRKAVRESMFLLGGDGFSQMLTNNVLINQDASIPAVEKGEALARLNKPIEDAINSAWVSNFTAAINNDYMGIQGVATGLALEAGRITDMAVVDYETSKDPETIDQARVKLAMVINGLTAYDKQRPEGAGSAMATRVGEGNTLGGALANEMNRLTRLRESADVETLNKMQLQSLIYRRTNPSAPQTTAMSDSVWQWAQRTGQYGKAVETMTGMINAENGIIDRADRQREKQSGQNLARERLAAGGTLSVERVMELQATSVPAGGISLEDANAELTRIQQGGEPFNRLTQAMKPIILEQVDTLSEQARTIIEKKATETDAEWEQRIQREVTRQVQLRANDVVNGVFGELTREGKSVDSYITTNPGLLRRLLQENLDETPISFGAGADEPTKKSPTEAVQERNDKIIESINNAGGKDTRANYPEATRLVKKSLGARWEQIRRRPNGNRTLLRLIRNKHLELLSEKDRINRKNGEPSTLRDDFVNELRKTQQDPNKVEVNPANVYPSTGGIPGSPRKNLLRRAIEAITDPGNIEAITGGDAGWMGPQSSVETEAKMAEGFNRSQVTMAMVMPEAEEVTVTEPAPAAAPSQPTAEPTLNEGVRRTGRTALAGMSGELRGPQSIEVIPFTNETPEGYQALAGLTAGRTQITDTTPALPQIDAGAPVARMSLDVSNPNHPWNLSRMAADIYRRRMGGPAFDPTAGEPILQFGGTVSSLANAADGYQGGATTSWTRDNDNQDSGYDIVLPGGEGAPILAPTAMRIDYAQREGSGSGASGRGFGNLVVGFFEGSDGRQYELYLGHMDEMRVRPGDIVQMGQVIGTQGNTGRSPVGAHVSMHVNAPNGGDAWGELEILMNRYIDGWEKPRSPNLAIPQNGLTGNERRFLDQLSWLESSHLPNAFNTSGAEAAGYFQFIPGTVDMGEKNYGIPNFRQRILSNDRGIASVAARDFIKAENPRAHALILKGDYEGAYGLLKGTWPSLPGGSQSNPDRVQQSMRFLQ